MNCRALGYYEVAELSGQNGKNLAREEETRKQNTEVADVTVYKPDFSQMTPFKPKLQWTPGEHIAPGIIFLFIFFLNHILKFHQLILILFVTGGCFPLPPAASQLCSMLPPPHCFHGPFVIVDPVMELIKHLNITESGKLRDFLIFPIQQLFYFLLFFF